MDLPCSQERTNKKKKKRRRRVKCSFSIGFSEDLSQYMRIKAQHWILLEGNNTGALKALSSMPQPCFPSACVSSVVGRKYLEFDLLHRGWSGTSKLLPHWQSNEGPCCSIDTHKMDGTQRYYFYFMFFHQFTCTSFQSELIQFSLSAQNISAWFLKPSFCNCCFVNLHRNVSKGWW